MTLGEVKRSNIIKFGLPCQFQRFLYQTLCLFSQIKDRNHIAQNFILLLGSCPRGGTWGAGGGSKTLAWRFAMEPHRLHILVIVIRSSLAG